MKNSYTPYYNMPDCYSEYETYEARPNGIFPNVTPTTGPTGSPATDQLQPITPITEPQAITLESTEYMNGYLRTQIGKIVRIEFLIGTGTLIDRTGTLLSVGANYLTIRQVQTNDIVVCDFFSIKFITLLS
ncbi:MAG: hypothetical protein ACYDG2_19585 [Ruminiclostridium sp.]